MSQKLLTSWWPARRRTVTQVTAGHDSGNTEKPQPRKKNITNKNRRAATVGGHRSARCAFTAVACSSVKLSASDRRLSSARADTLPQSQNKLSGQLLKVPQHRARSSRGTGFVVLPLLRGDPTCHLKLASGHWPVFEELEHGHVFFSPKIQKNV